MTAKYYHFICSKVSTLLLSFDFITNLFNYSKDQALDVIKMQILFANQINILDKELLFSEILVQRFQIIPFVCEVMNEVVITFGR